MAVLFWLSLQMGFYTVNRLARYCLFGVALFATINIMLMLDGRSGQLALLVVLFYGAWRLVNSANPRQFKISVILVCLIVMGILSVIAQNQKNARAFEIANEIESGAETSSGMRLAFYKLGLELFLERPLTGYGAYSLERQSAKMIERGETQLKHPVVNPHNEYILMAEQTGILGLSLFVSLIFFAFREASKLGEEDGLFLKGYVLIFASGCGVNSLLLDFVEGYQFVLIVGMFLAPLYATKPEASPAV